MASAQQMYLDWLSGPVMTDLVASETVAAGAEKVLPPKLYEFSNTSPVGVNVEWETTIGVRGTAKAVAYLAPSQTQETQSRQRLFATAVGTRMNTPLEGEMLIGLMSGVPQWAERAKRILMQKARDFRFYADNLKTALVHSAFANDAIYIDSGGNLLPNSTGAVGGGFKFNSLYAGANSLTKTSYWPGLPTGVASNLVGDWSSTSFDIPTSIRSMQKGYRFTSNYRPMTIMYGKNIPAYFYNNTALQTYMSRQPAINQEMLLTNEIPKGMLDINWVPAYDAYFTDKTGTPQGWWADNQITIIPDVNLNWYENFECSLPCPKGMVNTVAGDWDSFISGCPPVKGYSSYVIPHWDPIHASMVAQWYGWPAIKSNLASWSATVS
jgi:hypothetical protein